MLSIAYICSRVSIYIFIYIQECPPSRAFDELRVGMYVEIAADATSAYQAIYQLYLSYRDVLSEHLQGAPRSGPVSEFWQPSSSNDDNISSTTSAFNKRSSSGSSSKEWFQEAELRAAQSKWEALSSAEDERRKCTHNILTSA